MKRALSLILVLVLCLGLCACGKKSKYVGTYNDASKSYLYDQGSKYEVCINETMTLNKDGTGTLVWKAVDTNSNFALGRYPLEAGQIMASYDLTWSESDGYITIVANGYKYFKQDGRGDIFAPDSAGVPHTYTQTYELKGAQLFRPNETSARFTKVS